MTKENTGTINDHLVYVVLAFFDSFDQLRFLNKHKHKKKYHKKSYRPAEDKYRNLRITNAYEHSHDNCHNDKTNSDNSNPRKIIQSINYTLHDQHISMRTCKFQN